LATGNTLMGRNLNALARRYFLASRRPDEAHGAMAGHEIRRGEAGRPADGAVVSFELRIADGIVKSARFTAYGCPHTVAVAAWLCETLEGHPIGGPLPGSPMDWAEKFAVPAEKLGRLLIVEDALRAAS
jgi:hypothetical protein